MSSEKPQSYENHARWVPLYHFVISTVLLANLVWSVCLLVRGFSWPTVLGVLMALAFFGIFFYARFFALRVQDRVIRLEMRLRLKDVLPAELQGRIADLTADQLIGLRFSGDDEIAALTREALEKNLTRQQIKQKIRHWRADHYRA
jgi:hypothetical protein